MDLFQPSEKTYCQKINSSKYAQDISEKRDLFPTIIELLFHLYDPCYSMTTTNDKQLYVKQKIIEIASDIDENPDDFSKKNYSKVMNSNVIQHGLQKNNTLSSLLYLSDIYNVSINVYIESKKLWVSTSLKNRDEIDILYTNNGKWTHFNDNKEEYKESEFSILSECLVMDVIKKSIYVPFLQAISKYKVSELTKLAEERNIPIMLEGKKRVKKELYDLINIYELNK